MQMFNYVGDNLKTELDRKVDKEVACHTLLLSIPWKKQKKYIQWNRSIIWSPPFQRHLQ